jgi:acetyl-CoA carboxylase carboxyltransferase component
MSWEKSIEELRRRERLAEKMGGEEPVERQRGRGKLTVRERVAFLADPGSFHESARLPGGPPIPQTMSWKASCRPTP